MMTSPREPSSRHKYAIPGPEWLQNIFLALACVATLGFPKTTSAQNTADLSLRFEVVAVDFAVGDTVTVTAQLANDGPDTAGGVEVQGWTYQFDLLDVASNSGELAFNGRKLVWRNLTLDSGETLTASVQGVVRRLPGFVHVEVSDSDAYDPDSRPGRRAGEDDSATYTFAEEGADLSLHMWVDPEQVAVGDTAYFTVVVRNDGPDATDGFRVDAKTKHLDMTSASASTGTTQTQRHSLKWESDRLDVGESTTLRIATVVSRLPAVLAAEVKKSAVFDPDSRPGWGVAEDDNGTITFSRSGVSSGASAGLESNGALAPKLAQVLFQRRRTTAQLVDDGRTVQPRLFEKAEAIERARAVRAQAPWWNHSIAGKNGGSLSHDLRTAIPEQGPGGVAAREVSPEDLLPVTNAIDLVAVEYAQPDGRRLGVVFAASTDSDEIYEHTKVVCDRLRGASLEAIEIVHVDGQRFVATQLVQEDGTVDYALSFVAYDLGSSFEIDSRFVLGHYDPPATGRPTYNYQVWSDSRDDAISIVAEMLSTLEATAPVRFLTADDEIVVPDVYVRTGEYREGELVLEVVNRAGATDLILEDGTVTRTEGGERTDFSATALLPPIDEDSPYESTVRIELGPVFDADFAVTSDSSESPDLLYLADGSWSWAVDNDGVVESFVVHPDNAERLRAPGTYAVERGSTLAGQLGAWATMFRYLQASGAPVDLSMYSYVEFTASGEGTMRVQLEKESRQGSSQFGQSVVLSPTPRTYRFWFEDLTTSDGLAGFTATDVVLLSFNAENRPVNGAPASDRFEMNVEDVRFRGGATDVASTRPDGPLLHQSYPNPVEGLAQIRFDLPEPGHIRVGVFDVLGRRVASLADGWHAPGPHTVTFDVSSLATGMYFTWLESDLGFQTRSLIVR